MTRSVAGACALLGICAALSSATAQAQDHRVYLSAYIGAGGGGAFRLQDDPFYGDVDFDAGPSMTLGGTAEFELLKYLRIGGLLEGRMVKFINPLAEDEFSTRYLNVDVLVRGLYPLDVGGFQVSPFVAVPVGFTTTFDKDGSDAYYGANVGALFGTEITLLDGRLAPSMAVGVRWQSTHDPDSAAKITLLQFEAEIGCAFIFGT